MFRTKQKTGQKMPLTIASAHRNGHLRHPREPEAFVT
jgi:hypothetical protein